MNRSRFRVPLRWWLATIGSLAVLLAVVRQIEQAEHRTQARNNARWAEDSRSYARWAGEAEQYERQRAWHEAQLTGLPRSLSYRSVIAIVAYLWLAALGVVRARERPTDETFRPSFRPLAIWLGLGTIAPASILALGLLGAAVMPMTHAVGKWLSQAVGILFLVQVVHAMIGVVVLRGRRPEALAISLPSILITFCLFLFAIVPFID